MFSEVIWEVRYTIRRLKVDRLLKSGHLLIESSALFSNFESCFHLIINCWTFVCHKPVESLHTLRDHPCQRLFQNLSYQAVWNKQFGKIKMSRYYIWFTLRDKLDRIGSEIEAALIHRRGALNISRFKPLLCRISHLTWAEKDWEMMMLNKFNRNMMSGPQRFISVLSHCIS